MGESARAPSREVGTLKFTAVKAFCLLTKRVIGGAMVSRSTA